MLRALFIGMLYVLATGLPANAMQIFVLLPSGAIFTIDIEPSSTIEDVKQKIQDREGIAPSAQKLTFLGKELMDARTLSDYNIQPSSSLQMELRDPASSLVEIDTNTSAAFLLQSITQTVATRAAARLAAVRAGQSSYDTWISAGASQLTGFHKGGGANLAIGADMKIGTQTIAGVHLDYSGATTRQSGGQTTTNAAILGAYFAATLARGIVLDGHVSAAQLTYSGAETTFDGAMILGAVGASGAWDFEYVTLTPSLRISGYRQKTARYETALGTAPATNTRYWSAQAGLRAQARHAWGKTGLRSYLDLSATRSGHNSSLSAQTARVALGVGGAVGRALTVLEWVTTYSGRGGVDRQISASFSVAF